MQQINALLAQLGDPVDVNAIRVDIVTLILERLEASKDTLDDWQKTHYANAIGALAMNVNALQQPTIAWLRLCLSDLGRAIAPPHQRDVRYLPRDVQFADVTYEQLIAAVDSIGRKLE